ncbi:MAG: DUF2961 domain-containing protein [Anaerolineales bacterium]|nr:DUF2961 domain-containing protein [Anaerolineales bacterium]
MNLGNLSRLSNAKTRSISSENKTGGKGQGAMATEGLGAKSARDLGPGWKISPLESIAAGETLELANIEGSGAIQQMWMTQTYIEEQRFHILRIYWDDQENPSVECPVGDFFCSAWKGFAPVVSSPVCVNPGSAYNCYWEMPFKKKCRITMTNISDNDMTIYYQINYTLTDVPEDCAYFHAQFRRTNPLPYKDVYTILDGVKGQGHYIGTYMAWGLNNDRWWGEGEIKFYMDGDKDFPTICGTGEEDYFCGSYGYNDREIDGKMYYSEFSSLYAGFYEVKDPEIEGFVGVFGQYRWHIEDPVRFEEDLKITIQCLGWGADGYLPLEDELASVAYWYQTEPHHSFPPLPSKENLVIRKSVKDQEK